MLLEALADNLSSSVNIARADTGLHVAIWIKGIAADREPAIIEAARTAGVGLYAVSPLYDPTAPDRQAAGFILGYAGLEADALRRGVAVLATVLAGHR